MLLKLLSVYLLSTPFVRAEGQVSRPYIFPIPFELPNRNDRADQCWLRIEDAELIETLTVYCHLAQEFLRSFIRDYNNRKMTEDGVDVSLWSEEPRSEQKELSRPPDTLTSNGQKIKDWKETTVMDPTTHKRLYITQNAECRMVMYSREGMTNYKVDCASILYFVNHHMSGSAVWSAKSSLVTVACVLALLVCY